MAITGICAFAVPDYSLSFHIRMMRFIYIILGYFAGFLGIAFCIVLHLGMVCSINSFGVSYLSPYAPDNPSETSGYFLKPLWKRKDRRAFLNTKRPKKQDSISMKWRSN